MSPRGVAIPQLREQLFLATERVLAREGVGGVTGRAVTREAGCATGLLHNHFGDFDDFLAEFIADRMRPVGASNETLRHRVGEGSVAANLVDFALSRFTPGMLYAVGFAVARPALFAKVRGARAAEGTPLPDAEKTLVEYLAAEQELGRLHANADPEALTLALIGAVHHLLLTQQAGTPGAERQIRRLADTLTSSDDSGASTRD